MKTIRRGYSKTNVAVCPDCKGVGTITIPGKHIGHGRYAGDTIEVCKTCKGSGMVKVKKKVIINITITEHKALTPK